VLGQEVFSEEALGELPVFGELVAAFEGCVAPVDSAVSITSQRSLNSSESNVKLLFCIAKHKK
jgi:hypothetical protein